MRDVILVLGMHRSGTSAAAGFLVKLGGGQPKTLMPADYANERGYFESRAMMAFHDELLASAGSSWIDWRQFNPAWHQSPTAAAFRKRAKQLFKEEFDGEPLAVLKDPRVCRFAPFWLKVLAGMKARARVVIPVRSPLEVVYSMRKRDGFSLATAALLWLRHMIDAEFASRALPRSVFTWDQLLLDWRGVAEKASTELGLPWPRLSDATAHEIENFLGYDLVHHEVGASELAARPDIHEWTMSAYAAMLELAREPRSSSALKALDEIRDAFNRASKMFGRTLFEEEIRSQDLLRKTAKLTEERDAARAELAGALAAKEQISLELTARDREARDLAQALDEAERGALAGKEQFAEVQALLSGERSQSESLQATLAAAESKLADELARAKRAESEQACIAGKLRQRAMEADARAEDAGIIVSALEVKTARFERDIERREQEAAAVLNSTSWRLSAPWRAYRRVVSRLRRLLHGKKMNPLFDVDWYLEQYPDVRAGELDPYDHYLRHGAAEGRNPSPLFDTSWYLKQNPSVNDSGENPLVHFYSVGAKEGRDPIPLFDVKWYLEQNPDVREDGVNPLKHFIEHGAKEGRNPHPLFDTKFYLKKNPDAAASGTNPLLHYIMRGAKEGRNPHPLFDAEWYLAENPEVAASGIDPLVHYLLHGNREGRDPNPFFDTGWYLAQNPGVARSNLNPLVHYLAVGAPNGSNPSPRFDAKWYLDDNMDVARAGMNPLEHFLRYGRKEGREPFPKASQPHAVTDAEIYCQKKPLQGDELALFVTHSPHGRLKPHVRHYLDSLKRQGISIVLIVAADAPFSAPADLLNAMDGIFVRRNEGYDFAAWAHILHLHPELFGAKILYLINDSLIGPTNDDAFRNLLTKIRESSADLVGLTDNYEISWHIQSYFLALKPRALSSAALRKFINGIVSHDDKDRAIREYEIPFASILKAAGLSCESIFPSTTELDNRTILHWKALFKSGFPFIKLAAIRSDRVDTSDWREILAAAGYDVSLAEHTLAEAATSSQDGSSAPEAKQHLVRRTDLFASPHENMIQQQGKMPDSPALLGGARRRRSAPWRAYRRRVSRLRRLLRGEKMNPLFDRKWYLRQYPDVREGELDPYDHYLRYGAAEGRNPNPHFDTSWYLANNPDVRASGINPLVHYFRHGRKEGRPTRPPTFGVGHGLLPEGNSRSSPRDRDTLEAKLERIRTTGLFSPEAYLEAHEDLRSLNMNPWDHFSRYGLFDGRAFTCPETVMRMIAELDLECASACAVLRAKTKMLAASSSALDGALAGLVARRPSIGIYVSSAGNFYMDDIARCIASGLANEGLPISIRTDAADVDEHFDLHIIVAPHEFFYLGDGQKWISHLDTGAMAIINVEQVHTPWFARALPFLLKVPLVLDLNLQSTIVLKSLGCNAVHFMPGFSESGPFSAAVEDVSGIELLRGYQFARHRFDWRSQKYEERPLDVLFAGTQSPRRDKALRRLLELGDEFRFILIYPPGNSPFGASYHATSRQICSIAQRTKVAVNLHRDNLGYFEWHRIALQGIWQGAVVCSDPCLPNPFFSPSEHYFEENSRHLGEQIRWGLSSGEGKRKFSEVSETNRAWCAGPGSMRVSLAAIAGSLVECAGLA